MKQHLGPGLAAIGMALLVIAAGKVAIPIGFLMYLIVFLAGVAMQKWTTVFFFLLLTLILGDSRQSWLLYWYNLRFIGILFLFLSSFYFLISKKIKFNKSYLILLPFTLIAIASAVKGPIFTTAITKMVSYLLINFIAIHYIQFLSNTNKSFKYELSYFLITLVSMGLILSPIAHNLVWFRGIDRFNGIWGNPNGLGMSVFLYTIIIHLTFKDQKNKNIVYLFYFLGFINLYLSASRGSLIAVFLFLVLFFWQKTNTWIKVVSIGVVLPTVLFLSDPINLLKVANALGVAEKFRIETVDDGGGRFLAWQVATSHMNEVLLLGKGFDYDIYLFKDYLEFFLAKGHEGNVHNSFITLILAIGIPGLTILLVYYASLISKIKHRSYIIPITISCTFSAFFESWLSGSLNPFLIFFLTAIIIASHDESQEHPVPVH